ncbi:MAG: hypothetical protein K9G60_13410 [Pseudolabrys sp.]|nr:hypothetical protein [Pseudolabrys sp.]
MRKASGATVAMIMGIALYFTLFWGFDALRVLTSPTYGLEDVWRSQFVFGVGSYFNLAPMGLLKLAAFFGTVKLAVAAVCAIHLVDRLRTLAGGTANSDVLEGGLILVVAISIVSVGPAIWSHNADLVREQTLQLLLAALATALCMVERSYARTVKIEVPAVAAAADVRAVAAAPRLHA